MARTDTKKGKKKAEEQAGSSMLRGAALVAAAAAVALKLSGDSFTIPTNVPKRDWDLVQPSDPSWAVPAWMQVEGNIEVIDFSELTSIDERVPLLIKNSPASQWEAIGKWTPAYLSEHVPEFKRVRLTKNNNTKFLYYDDRLLMAKWDPEGEVIPKSNYYRKNMTSEEFFAAERSMYYSHEFQTFLEDKLDKDLGQRQFMYVVDNPENVGTALDYSTNFWVAKAGITAGMHYDLTHNMYVQINGCKRFLLVEPKDMLEAKIFPRDHPNDRQSQLEVKGVGQALGVTLRARVADLGPGDMLYLPPGFGHRVAAFECGGESFSVSLNTWSKSIAKDIAERTRNIENIPERFRHIQKENHLTTVRALRVYLDKIVKAVAPSKTAQQVVQEVVRERYEAQADLAEAMECANFDPTKCPNSIFDATALETDDPETYNEVLAEADKMIALFRSDKLDLDQGMMNLLLADFVERVSILVVSIPKVCPYLKCFAAQT